MVDTEGRGRFAAHRRQAGSHRYCAGPETGYLSVGAGLPAMRPALTQDRWGGGCYGSKAASRDSAAWSTVAP